MTTNPSNTRKRSARKAAAPTTRKRSAASVKADVVEALAAETPKARKRVAATVEPVAKPKLSDADAHALALLHAEMTRATAAFEEAVVGLLTAGASPSHVGAAVSMGNSSIRRIGWRHGWSNA